MLMKCSLTSSEIVGGRSVAADVSASNAHVCVSTINIPFLFQFLFFFCSRLFLTNTDQLLMYNITQNKV